MTNSFEYGLLNRQYERILGHSSDQTFEELARQVDQLRHEYEAIEDVITKEYVDRGTAIRSGSFVRLCAKS